MLKIAQQEEIKATKAVVWKVIKNGADYPNWNPFVVACRSTFEVGTPIVMRVRVLPFFAMPQKETIFQNDQESLLEYGIKLPFGLLRSSRKHVLKEISENTTRYVSVFELSGPLSLLVEILLGAQLRRGFRDMTNGVVARSEELGN